MDLVWVFELIFCRNHCSPVCLFCYFLIAYPCLVGFCFADSVVHASRNRKVQTMSRTLWVFRLSIDCLESNISIFTALVTDKKKKYCVITITSSLSPHSSLCHDSFLDPWKKWISPSYTPLIICTGSTEGQREAILTHCYKLLCLPVKSHAGVLKHTQGPML